MEKKIIFSQNNEVRKSISQWLKDNLTAINSSSQIVVHFKNTDTEKEDSETVTTGIPNYMAQLFKDYEGEDMRNVQNENIRVTEVAYTL